MPTTRAYYTCLLHVPRGVEASMVRYEHFEYSVFSNIEVFEVFDFSKYSISIDIEVFEKDEYSKYSCSTNIEYFDIEYRIVIE